MNGMLNLRVSAKKQPKISYIRGDDMKTHYHHEGVEEQ
jgi:hypothetical protein